MITKRAVLTLLFVAVANSACGVLLSKGPPVGHEKMQYFTCTETDVYPVLDVAWGLLNVVGALIVASDPSGYEDAYNTDAGPTIIVGFAWGVASTASAITGFNRASKCREAKSLLAQRQAAGRTSGAASPATVLVQSVVVTPQNVALAVGQSQQLVAAAYHSSGVTVPDRSFTWSSSNDAIASVSDAGLVTANAPGIVTIAASTGNLVGTTRIVVVEARE